MKTNKFYQNGFLIAALYDLFLGLIFFLFYSQIYSMFNIKLPENPAYLHLSAAFVIAQGVLYYMVYKNMDRNRDIVKVGIVYKISYVSVIFYYWAIGGLPHSMFGIFGILDIIFVGFFVSYLKESKAAVPVAE